MIVACLWPKHESNLGTLARTCAAVGADLVVPRGHESAFGAANTCRYQPLTVEDPARWLEDVLASRRPVFGIETGGHPIWQFEPDDSVVLVLGHESNGIPTYWQRKLRLVSLPMVGRSPCINVAVAGSVAAYHFSGMLAGAA